MFNKTQKKEKEEQNPTQKKKGQNGAAKDNSDVRCRGGGRDGDSLNITDAEGYKIAAGITCFPNSAAFALHRSLLRFPAHGLVFFLIIIC